MKHLFIFALFCIAASSQAQSGDFSPIRLHVGKSYTPSNQSVWVISEIRMRYYDDLHKFSDKDTGSDVNALVAAYEAAQRTDANAIAQLTDLNTKSLAELRIMLNTQRHMLTLAQTNAQELLSQNIKLQDSLGDLKKDIKKANRGRTWRTLGLVLVAVSGGYLAAQII